MPHVCSWRLVRSFDNFLRPLIHDPKKMFGPYVEPGMRVADLGCGAGFAAIGLAKLVGKTGRVVAVDLQPQMLEMVEKRSHKAGLSERIETQLCRADTLDLKGGFDFVNAFYMVHEVPDREAFLRQVHAALDSNGKCFIAEPIFHVSKNGFSEMLECGGSVGFTEFDRPKVRLSRTVVFSRSA